jgi:hypothetical protein
MKSENLARDIVDWYYRRGDESKRMFTFGPLAVMVNASKTGMKLRASSLTGDPSYRIMESGNITCFARYESNLLADVKEKLDWFRDEAPYLGEERF